MQHQHLACRVGAYQCSIAAYVYSFRDVYQGGVLDWGEKALHISKSINIIYHSKCEEMHNICEYLLWKL